ncbi:hypothetical protein Mapa_012391 [Marchantia paleacea]|nr:hypothetical protein Mapa_012391 [Marchantia paleacea]
MDMGVIQEDSVMNRREEDDNADFSDDRNLTATIVCASYLDRHVTDTRQESSFVLEGYVRNRPLREQTRQRRVGIQGVANDGSMCGRSGTVVDNTNRTMENTVETTTTAAIQK